MWWSWCNTSTWTTIVDLTVSVIFVGVEDQIEADQVVRHLLGELE